MNKKMRARKRRQARRVALTLVLMLTVALVSIGGTIAWLTASTQAVTNTFTVGNITIDLNESTYVPATNSLNTATPTKSNANYKMVPGNTLPKDPYVTITAGSEACYLFVEVVESSTLDTYISYTVDSSKWTETTLTGKNGGTVYVYTADIGYTSADTNYSILTSNQVTVNNGVTKTQMEALNATGAVQPTLTFYGYAVQKDNVADYTTAWSKL